MRRGSVSCWLLVLFLWVMVVSAYELHWEDPVGDVYGNHAASSWYDIVAFTIQDDSVDNQSFQMSITLAELSNPHEAPLGWSSALIQCYIHTSPLGSWRVQQEGSSSVIGNPNIALSPLYRWSTMIELSGWGSCVVNSVGEKMCLPISDISDSTVTASIPFSLLGSPEEQWSYTLLVGPYSPPDGDFELAPLQFFGEEDISEGMNAYAPRVADILSPPGAALSQDSVLNGYCTVEKKYAVIAPISLQLPPYVHGPSSAAPLQDGGNGCLSSPSSIVTSRYDVVETASHNGVTILRLELITPGMSELGPDIADVVVTIDETSPSIVRISIDANDGLYSPIDVIQEDWNESNGDSMYQVDIVESPFGFRVRRTTGEVLFDTTGKPDLLWPNLVFKERYAEISSWLPGDRKVYGLGERVGSFALERNRVYSMWNLDQGTPEGRNLYGVHPFYLGVQDQMAHGVFLLNSYGMDFAVSEEFVTIKTLGGVLDFFVFLGPEPEMVVQQYQRVIGRPALPPFWALGAHQCRWGYSDVDELRDVVLEYDMNYLPLDAMWSDIDYMDQKKLFTLDPINYPEEDLVDFIDELHNRHRRYVVIVDPGVREEAGYSVYMDGLDRDVFISNANGTAPALGKVWPGPVAFIDFLKEDSVQFWREQVSAFHRRVAFDGLWIDMNEIANFCDGHCVLDRTVDTDWDTLFDCPCDTVEFHDEDFPPYWVGDYPPGTSTLSMASLHDGGLRQEQVHTLYGHEEAIATVQALMDIRQERALVITRSTFAGSGHHAGHWLGDNTATWDDLRWSITGMMSMNLFGIPLTGADICGFNGNTTAELCARWYQVGAWYPFCRNHNAIGALSQEPYNLGPTVLKVARFALLQRYRLLPEFYRWFVEVAEVGGTVIRPLFFEFADDPLAYEIEDQFMLGSSIMVAPVVEEAALERLAYFPSASTWYFLWKGTAVPTGETDNWVLFDSISITDTFVFVRSGSVLAVYDAALSTEELKTKPLSLIVALDKVSNSTGALYMDDGVSLDGKRSKWEFLAVPHSEGHSFGKLYVDWVLDEYLAIDSKVVWTELSVYGVEDPCDLAIVSTAEWEYYFWPGEGLEYDNGTQVLQVSGLNVSVTEPHIEITWGKSAEPPSWTFRIVVILSVTVAVVVSLSLFAVLWHFGTKHFGPVDLWRKNWRGTSQVGYVAPGDDSAQSSGDSDLFTLEDDSLEDGDIELDEMRVESGSSAEGEPE